MNALMTKMAVFSTALALACSGAQAAARDYYVDAVNGNDSNDGLTKETARKTLKAIMAVALGEGSVIHAARGEYREGVFHNGDDGLTVGKTSTELSPCRVFIRPWRTLIADEGPEVTTIFGASDPDGDEFGRGPNAVRCVAIGYASKLIGFTLAGGRSTTTSGEGANTDGGGVYYVEKRPGDGELGYVENCIFTNCVASRGGGMRWGTARRCTFIDCRCNAKGWGAATRSVDIYDCFFDYNKAGTCAYGRLAVGCTFAKHNETPANGRDWALVEVNEYTWDNQIGLLANCVFGGGLVKGGCVTNCVFYNADQIRYLQSYAEWTGGTGLFCGEGGDCSSYMNADGTLVRGSPAIDAAATFVKGACTDAEDLAGNQRVYNNALDCGCFEYDWRGDYASRLCRKRGFAVTDVTPNAVAEAESGVLIYKGELQANWKTVPGGYYSSVCQVTGSGVLTLMRNGEPWATLTNADGERRFEFRSESASNDLSFSYEPGAGDAGGARIARCEYTPGLQLMLR